MQIDAIARRVAERIGTRERAATASSGAAQALASGGALPMGVFRSIDECVSAARIAFEALSRLGLQARHAIIASIRDRLLTLPANTTVHTGHGGNTSIGAEAPQLADWIARGH